MTVSLFRLDYRKNGAIRTKFYNTKVELAQMKQKLHKQKLKTLSSQLVQAVIKTA